MNWKERLARWGIKRSPWVYHVNTGACNNCDIEILDVLCPRFDAERFGIKLVGTPRHADVLLVSGPVTRHTEQPLRDAYEATPKPCAVVAFGACGCSSGIFKDGLNVNGTVDRVIREEDPEAIITYVPGCPPRPEAIISAAVKTLEAL